MGENGGRNRIDEEHGYVRYQISVPPSLHERLEKYMKDEERPRSWCFQKAIDEWLKKKGY